MAAATKIVTRLPVDFCSLKFGAGVRSAPKLKSQVVAQKRYDTQTKEHLTNIIRLHASSCSKRNHRQDSFHIPSIHFPFQIRVQ